MHSLKKKIEMKAPTARKFVRMCSKRDTCSRACGGLAPRFAFLSPHPYSPLFPSALLYLSVHLPVSLTHIVPLRLALLFASHPPNQAIVLFSDQSASSFYSRGGKAGQTSERCNSAAQAKPKSAWHTQWKLLLEFRMWSVSTACAGGSPSPQAGHVPTCTWRVGDGRRSKALAGAIMAVFAFFLSPYQVLGCSSWAGMSKIAVGSCC